jgi:hypothetical protein
MAATGAMSRVSMKPTLASPVCVAASMTLLFLLGLAGALRRQQEHAVTTLHRRIQRVGLVGVAQCGLQPQVLDPGGIVRQWIRARAGVPTSASRRTTSEADVAGGTRDQDHDGTPGCPRLRWCLLPDRKRN